MANNGKSYSVQKELDKKYGVKSSSGRASGNTSVQDTLDQKYGYENSSQRRASVQDWSRRYSEAARAYGETGGTLTDESGDFRNRVNTLIQDYGKIKGYSGRMGLPNGQDYIRALRGMVDATGKNRRRASTASGLIPEDASALAGQKQKYERMLFELQKQMKEQRGAESVQAEIEGVERSKATEEREKEIRSLQGTLGDINSRLNIYNRIDKFGDDVTAKYAGGNSMEAREAWRGNREQENRAPGAPVNQYGEIAGTEGITPGGNYGAIAGQDAGYVVTEQDREQNAHAKNVRTIEKLDEYLTWFDGLTEESKRRIRSSDVNGRNPYRDSEIIQNDPGYQNKHWGQMTEDERNAVFQIANTEGTDAAAKYLEDLQMTLDRRQTLAMEQNEKDRAEKTPLIGDMLRGAATVGANLVGAPISFIGNARDAIKGKGFNPYSNANFLLNQSGAVREASSQEVYKAVAGDGSSKTMNALGELASNAYQAGLSTLDSLAGMATMGKFYTVSMGMGAASQRMRELVESGASDREIYVGAIGSGILEALFEKVSLDTFSGQWIKANPEKFIRKALIQAGVEGSEEVFTEISNQILDAVNRGVNSDHNVRVRALMKENPGMSETEAEQQAASEDAQEVFWAGFGGALSGGLSSFGGLAIEGHKARQGGTEILSRGQAGEVLQNALELRPNDKTAQNLQSKLSDNTLGKKGRDLSGLYRVAQQNAADMTHADVESVRAGLEKRFAEMGVPNNGKATAEAIIKQITGEKLSLTDRLALAKNRDAAATVWNEIVSAAAYPTAANKWVRDIKTFQLGNLAAGVQMFGTAETQTQKSARETMEKALNQVMGSNSALVSALYEDGQSRSGFTTEAAEIYRAGQDGRGLDGVSLSTIGAKEAGIIYDMGVRSAEGMGAYDYIEEGQAYRKSDNTPVNVTGFASMGAEPTVSIGNGETVKATDVTFGSFGESRLYNTIAKMGVDTQTANSMLKAAEKANINASTYSVALNNAYMQGLSGIAFGNIRENSEAMRLDADTRKAAWSAGRAQAGRNDRAKQSVTDKGKHGRKAGGLTVEDSAKNVKLNRQQEAGMNAARVLAGMGLNVSVFASTEAERKDDVYNGIFRSADGSIRVDLNAGKDGQGVMGYALSHEFTHFVEELSAEKFRKFTDILFDVLGKNDVDVNRLIEAKEAVLRNTEEYKGRSEKELRAIAYSEAVAEMMEPVLTDTDAISRISQKIKQQDRSLWGKIKDFIKGIVEKLKAAYRDMEPDSAIARLTRETVTNSEAVLDAFSEAAADAVLNYNLQEGQKNNAREGGQFMSRNSNDSEIVSIKQQIAEAKDELTQMQSVANVAVQDLSKMTQKQRYDWAVNELKRTGYKVDRPNFGVIEFTPKQINTGMNYLRSAEDVAAFAVLPKVLKQGNIIFENKNHKGRQFATFTISAPVTINGTTGYMAVVVQETSSRHYHTHRIVLPDGSAFKFEMQHSDPSGGFAQNSTRLATNTNAASTDSVAQPNADVKGNVRYSARQATKNLVALHNLTEEKLLKSLELGGFPMPSIAITKADIPHTNFGNITVVFGKETIDPKARRENTVYSADAWTPVVPRVEYEADSKVTDRVYNRLGALKNQVAEYFQHDLDTLRYSLEDRLNRDGGEAGILENLRNNYALKAAFLEEQGTHIEQQTKQVETAVNSISSEMEDKLLNVWEALGKPTPDEIGSTSMKEIRDTYGSELEKAYPGMTKSAFRMSTVLGKLRAYLSGEANATKTSVVADGEAMKKAVDAAVDQGAFERWARELFSGIEKSKGVYNGKERFTPSGNLRSFKATHIPATLEGIVQAMRSENGGNTKNVSGFSGVKTLRAATAEEFGSIADMHRAEGRLQNLTEEQVSQIQDKLGDRLYKLMNDIDAANTKSRWSDNSFIRMDSIGENLTEIGESGRYTPENVKRVFAKYGMEVSDHTAQEVVQLLFDISQMPVNIFEAKPKRAVRFEEIRNVLVPDTASQKLLRELDNRGIPYQVYEAGNEAQRQQMVSQMDDVRFSSRAQRDSEYLNLAQNSEENREVLSRMVENAAREAGYTRLFFHGSKKGGGFTVFRDWQYFTENREYAKRYANRENPGSLYETYVKMENPFDTRIPEVRELFEQARQEYGMGELQENGLPDWTDGYDIADYIDENDLPYDGIILDEGGDMVNGKPVSRGLSYVIRDSSQVKSADAVTYDDNGNVIPLSQRFDTGKEDIRYSARNPQAQVEAENERLKTELEYLKKLVQIQKRGNKDFTLDRNSLRKAARALMNANNVKGNVAELAEILDRVYRYAGTEPEITWEGFAEKAGEAADWLTENRVKERDPYAQQVLDAVAKRRVSLNAEQIGEIEYRYGSLSEFKKAIKGSIILDQNANTSLDQLWQELSGEYPGTFDAGTTDADMPGAFADIVDELRNSESANEAERHYYADEERNQLIRQVYDGYWDVDPVQSVSDKAKKEIDQLKAEHREAIRELKAENRQLKSDAQSQVAAAVREYRQQNNAMTRETKKTYERQLKEVQKGYEKFKSQAESLSSESTLRYQNEFYNALMGTENLGKAKVPELRKKFLELAVENSGKDMDARKARQAEYTRLLDEFLTSRDIGKLRTTIQEQRDRVKAKVEAARVTEQRGKLYRAVNEINRRLLNPTKTLYVPDSLAPAVTKFMQGLTEAMESPKNSWNVQGALETLQGQYQKLTQMNEGVFTQEYNQGILDLLDNAINAVGGTDFNKLSASQIEDVYSAVRSVLTAIRNENKMFAANLNKTYAEAAEAVRREEAALPNRKPTTGAVQDKAEKFGWNQLKPVYAMMRLGSDTLLKQYNNLRAGEDKWQRIIAAARAYGLGIMEKYHYDQWNDNLMKLDTETGTVELSLEERMSLYAYARREQAFEHLTKGGFVLSDKNTRTVKNRFGIKTEQKVQDYNAYVLTEEQVAGIRGAENILQLTEEQRQFADAMQDYLSTVCAELNNEISRALYGVSIAKEKYYWPIKSSGVFSEMIRNQMQNPSNRQKNAGHMKATVRGANNAIELMGFMETWATHVNNTAMYNAFTLPMEDFMRVWNWRDNSGLGNRSMRQLILQKHGQAGVDYIDTFIKDLNNGVRGDPRESLLNSMLGKFKKGAVSASLSVAIQQPSAVGRALKYIDPKYFLGARVEGVDGINATWEVMQQYAPVVGIKDIGRFDMDMGRSTIDILSGKNETGVMAAIDKLSGFLPEYMDKVTWVAMWEACKRQVKAQNPSLRGEALLTKAGELFTKTITETQVYDSVFSRSGLMRSPSVAAKAVTAFMAEPTTTANMVYQAIQDFRHGDRTGAARSLASVGTAIVLNSLLASLVYASRDDDEEKTWLEKYLKSFTAEMIDGVNPLGYIPVVKDIFSVFQGYDVIRSDMSQWADLAKTLQKFTKAWKSYGEADEDDREARKEALKKAGIASTNLLASILNLGGIPLRNLLREIQGGVNIVKDIQRGLPSDSRTKGYAIWEALNAYMPQIMRSDDGKSKQVYKAVTSGSAAWVNRLKSTYKNEDTFNRAVVTALVNNDSRIREAARAAVSGNSAERDRLAKEIVKEGHFTEKQVEDAIEKRIEQLPGASYDDMLDALRNGGDVKAAQANLAKYGYTQTQMENKVKSAAKEWYQGGVISAIDARKMLRDYGGMLTRDAQATVQKWTALLSTGTDFDEIQDEYLTGNLSRSRAVEMYVKFGGDTQADAEATVKKWDCEKELGVKYDDLKDAYLGGDISADRVLSAMMKYGGVKEDSARATVEAYKWIRNHPKTELDVGQVKTYTKAIDTLGYSVEDAGISESVYLTFLEKASACTGEDRNGDGRTDSGSVRNQVVQVIDALPISGTQKDALYFAKGYAKRDLHKAPWH